MTLVKFHPQQDRRLILACGTSGDIGLCQYLRGEYVWRAQELDTKIFPDDFSMDRSHFATTVKVRTLSCEFTTQLAIISRALAKDGVRHSSRIHSVVFHKSNRDILVTGGWDMRVLVWGRENRRSEYLRRFSRRRREYHSDRFVEDY